MALAALAKEWADECGVRTVAVTIDHGLRQESGEESRWVQAQLQKLGFNESDLVLVALGDQLSAAAGGRAQQHVRARTARLDAFKTACDLAGTSHVLTAHHAGDQCETFVQRLYRASGISGLTCTADASFHAGLIKHHPFLSLPKARLVATCEARDLEWAEDPSNVDDAYDRSRARKGLAQAEQHDRTGSLRSDLASARDVMVAVEAVRLAAGRRLTEAFCVPDAALGGVWLDGLGLLRAAASADEAEAGLAAAMSLATGASFLSTLGNAQAMQSLRRHLEEAAHLERVPRWSGLRNNAGVVSRRLDAGDTRVGHAPRGRRSPTLPPGAPRHMFFCHQTGPVLGKLSAAGMQWDQELQRMAGPTAAIGPPVRGVIGLDDEDQWQAQLCGYSLRADGEPSYVGCGVVAGVRPDAAMPAHCPSPWGIASPQASANGDGVESFLDGRFIPRAFVVGEDGEPLQPGEELTVRRLGKLAFDLFYDIRGVSSRKKGSKTAIDAPSAAPVVCRPVDLGDPCLLLLALSLAHDAIAAHLSPLARRLKKSIDAIEAAAQRQSSGLGKATAAASGETDAVEAEVVRQFGPWAARNRLGPLLAGSGLTMPLTDAMYSAIALSVVALPSRNVRLIPGVQTMWRFASSLESEVLPRRLPAVAGAAAAQGRGAGCGDAGLGAEAWDELMLVANEGAGVASTLVLAQDLALRRPAAMGDAPTRDTVRFLRWNR